MSRKWPCGESSQAPCAHLPEAWEPWKCSRPGTLLLIPGWGMLTKAMVFTMGNTKGGVPTASGTGHTLVIGAFKAPHRLEDWGSSLTPPSHSQSSSTPFQPPLRPFLLLVPWEGPPLLFPRTFCHSLPVSLSSGSPPMSFSFLWSLRLPAPPPPLFSNTPAPAHKTLEVFRNSRNAKPCPIPFNYPPFPTSQLRFSRLWLFPPFHLPDVLFHFSIVTLG